EKVRGRQQAVVADERVLLADEDQEGDEVDQGEQAQQEETGDDVGRGRLRRAVRGRSRHRWRRSVACFGSSGDYRGGAGNAPEGLPGDTVVWHVASHESVAGGSHVSPSKPSMNPSPHTERVAVKWTWKRDPFVRTFAESRPQVDPSMLPRMRTVPASPRHDVHVAVTFVARRRS